MFAWVNTYIPQIMVCHANDKVECRPSAKQMAFLCSKGMKIMTVLAMYALPRFGEKCAASFLAPHLFLRFSLKWWRNHATLFIELFRSELNFGPIKAGIHATI